MQFSVDGEFITNLARERFYQDNNPAGAIELLESCLSTDQISKEEIRGLAISVLDGTREIVGVYPGDDYGLEDTPEKKLSPGFMEHLKEITDEIDKLKTDLNRAYEKMSFLYCEIEDVVSPYKLNQIDARFADENDGEHLFDRSDDDTLEYYKKRAVQMGLLPERNSMLEDYMDSIKREREYDYNPEEDYGWLAPDGTYAPVPWGDHNEWAQNKLEELYEQPVYKTMREFKEDGTMENIADGMPGDVLVYKHHYALLDNPHQGNAILTYDEAYGLTKAQREFLYDYYKARGFDDKANDLYKDDEMERD